MEASHCKEEHEPKGGGFSTPQIDVANLLAPYAEILDGIAERNTGMTDQERGHLADLSRLLRKL